MIKATELRIGNLVGMQDPDYTSDPSDIHFTPAVICLDGIYIRVSTMGIQSVHRENDLIPIPLTPEILEKCGFSIDEIDGYYLKNDVCIVETDEGYHLTEGDTFNEYSLWIGKPFAFLHQLQNLYFALTGEELNVKL